MPHLGFLTKDFKILSASGIRSYSIKKQHVFVSICANSLQLNIIKRAIHDPPITQLF